MKKIALLLTLLCAVFAFSCKKETPNQGTTPILTVLTITVDDVYGKISMAVNADPLKIPVAVSAFTIGSTDPVPVSMLQDVAVSTQTSGVVECYIDSDGVWLEPVAVGTTKLTLSPKTLLGEPVSCEVTVTEKPAEPASVEIITTDSHFTGKTLKLLEGDSFNLQAIVKNDKGAVTSVPVTWSITKGTAYVSIDTDGHLTTQAAGSAIVSVEVDGYPTLTDNINVEVQAKPTGVTFSGISIDSRNNFITKVGLTTKTFSYIISPASAYDDFEVFTSNNKNVKAMIDPSKKEITLTLPQTSSASSTSVTVRSKSNHSASKSFNIYIFDYESNDLKPGDYVYYGEVLSGVYMFTYVDCGLRYFDGTTSVYEMNDGTLSSTPKSYSGSTLGTLSFVGVVVAPGKADLGCSVLSQCKNKDEDLLYGYRNFKNDNLTGMSGKHALVIKKDETGIVDWQQEGSNEYVAICPDNKSGVYQSQLYRELAFSAESKEKGYWYKPSSTSNPTHDDFSIYVSSGFVPYLLQKFYSDHLNNTNFKVIPTTYIDAYTDVPKFSKTSNLTTGWFLPGNQEWEKITANVKVVNASLNKVGATSLGGDYWSTEEYEEYQVWAYSVNASSNRVSRTLTYKDRRTSTGGKAARVRAVLYL